MHLHAPCGARQGQRPTPEFLRPVYQELDDPQPADDWTLKEALNKSILDFSAPAIGKAWFSDGSQNQQLAAANFGSASLRCGKR